MRPVDIKTDPIVSKLNPDPERCPVFAYAGHGFREQCIHKPGHSGTHFYPSEAQQETNTPEGHWASVWPRFSEAVQAKLAAGHREYGDGSFDRPLGELLTELKAEAVDLAGWGLIVFAAIEQMERKL